MGQSHSSEVTQQQQQQQPHNQQKRRSFLVTPKKLIRLRRQTSYEKSGALIDETTQTHFRGEAARDYNKSAGE
jgi:hypothetical protein